MDQTHINDTHLPLLHTYTLMIFPLLSFPSFSSPHFLPLIVMFDPRKQTANDSWEPLNFGFQVSKKHGNWTKHDGGEGIQFRVQEKEEHEDGGVESGASSPPLWQNSPPISPVPHSINYRSLSPSSRAQAIARGQWELMEMVKNMPESCYELSLKDLVEQPTTTFQSQENCLMNKEKNQDRVKIKRQESGNMNNKKKKNDQIKKAKMMRSRSLDNGGLFLKMVSPVPLRPKRKKKNTANTTNKVSPKPEECENSSKSLEKDWWKKRFSSSSESGSRRTNSSRNRSSGSNSSSSTNSSNRKRKGFLSSCWSGLCFTKSISSDW
ncbi:PREDICTED: uncharacterized protein LOC109205145 [Nicotiana attenuata]|uniref:Uncharacterized protein n=1 Tax=Nicotiana attenuata TaxID=49451 RepID=A0A314KYK2_NICAT|nr:PREDICTED: uncharacterized protein LOC109205145 [Nicotiana attenuata]OIT34097.1 hypothetical protein A4A49_17311 [Nicotiana attenuata]